MMDLSAFFQSGTILLREGLEAMLVIAALAAMLRRAGASEALLVEPSELAATPQTAVAGPVTAAWVETARST